MIIWLRHHERPIHQKSVLDSKPNTGFGALKRILAIALRQNVSSASECAALEHESAEPVGPKTVSVLRLAELVDSRSLKITSEAVAAEDEWGAIELCSLMKFASADAWVEVRACWSELELYAFGKVEFVDVSFECKGIIEVKKCERVS